MTMNDYDEILEKSLIITCLIVLGTAALSLAREYPLAGTVQVYWGRSYSPYELIAEYYCSRTGYFGYGVYVSKRPVVTCINYRPLRVGMLQDL